MVKTGAILAELDGLIRELHLIWTREKEDRVPIDQRKMTTEAMALLARARARLEEKEGGRKHEIF